MTKPAFALIIFVTGLFTLLDGCVDHNFGSGFTVECDANDPELSYTSDIVPIISANCLFPGCHGDNDDIPDWSVLANLQARGSEVQRRITLPLTDADKMPREGSITEEEREALYCWIQQGAQDN